MADYPPGPRATSKAPRYRFRSDYDHLPESPKEAALRVVVAERYKKLSDGSQPKQIPSMFGFPAYVSDYKSVGFERDGSMTIKLTIPPEHVEDFYHYIPFIAGQVMAVTMEPIRVTLEDI